MSVFRHVDVLCLFLIYVSMFGDYFGRIFEALGDRSWSFLEVSWLVQKTLNEFGEKTALRGMLEAILAPRWAKSARIWR